MQTEKQIRKRAIKIDEIIIALKAGHILSFMDQDRFGVTEMHTCIHNVRRKIEEGKIVGYVLKDKRCETADGMRYKQYWFEEDEKHQ